MEAILKQFQQFLKEYEEGFINDKECYDKIAFIILCKSAGIFMNEQEDL